MLYGAKGWRSSPASGKDYIWLVGRRTYMASYVTNVTNWEEDLFSKGRRTYVTPESKNVKAGGFLAIGSIDSFASDISNT